MPGEPKIVILGGGFAGLTLLKRLSDTAVDLVLVDRRNHHLFQPLLYQVATAALSSTDIAQPIRSILRGAGNVTVRLDEAVGLNLAGRQLLLADGGILAYDILVIAAGVEYNYFGHADWAEHAPSLKLVRDRISHPRAGRATGGSLDPCPRKRGRITSSRSRRPCAVECSMSSRPWT
jgi:NADH:ubiquinone reductase (H+-translocating)